jgi:hypothetical protein
MLADGNDQRSNGQTFGRDEQSRPAVWSSGHRAHQQPSALLPAALTRHVARPRAWRAPLAACRRLPTWARQHGGPRPPTSRPPTTSTWRAPPTSAWCACRQGSPQEEGPAPTGSARASWPRLGTALGWAQYPAAGQLLTRPRRAAIAEATVARASAGTRQGGATAAQAVPTLTDEPPLPAAPAALGRAYDVPAVHEQRARTRAARAGRGHRPGPGLRSGPSVGRARGHACGRCRP